MGDGGVRDEALHVLLRVRDHRAVDDPDDAESSDPRPVSHGRLRKERERESQIPVHAELQQHSGEEDRPRRRRLRVGVGKPGVEREHRHLDREGERESEEEHRLELRRKVDARQIRQEKGPCPCQRAVPRGDVQDGEEHQETSRHREQEELHRRVDPARAAPDADDEVHGNEHHFPEHVEEREVERAERPEDASLQSQKRDREPFHTLRNVCQGKDKRQRRQNGRQQNEDQGNSVDSERVGDSERRHPVEALAELEPGRGRHEPLPEGNREGELEDGHGNGESLDRTRPRNGEEEKKHRPGRRNEDQDGQKVCRNGRRH